MKLVISDAHELLLEQNDERAVQRGRYMTLESLAQSSDDPAVTLPVMAA